MDAIPYEKEIECRNEDNEKSGRCIDVKASRGFVGDVEMIDFYVDIHLPAVATPEEVMDIDGRGFTSFNLETAKELRDSLDKAIESFEEEK